MADKVARLTQYSEEQLELAKQLRAQMQPGDAKALAGQTIQKRFAKTYFYDPVAFCHDCISWPHGQSLTKYQEEILASVPQRKRVAVRGPHGLGKTALAALLTCWFSLTRDAAEIPWKAPLTASVWRQLTQYLVPEIHLWSKRIIWKRTGRTPFNNRRELMALELKLKFGRAFAMASDKPERMEGAHARSMLFVFDEAKAIPAGIFDAAEGAFSGAGGDTADEAFVLAISTPGPPVGRFYEIHKQKPGFQDWSPRHVKLEEAIAAGRLSRQWAEQRCLQWGGESSPIYQNRVLGEFVDDEELGVIPNSWVDLAVTRHEAALEEPEDDEGRDEAQ